MINRAYKELYLAVKDNPELLGALKYIWVMSTNTQRELDALAVAGVDNWKGCEFVDWPTKVGPEDFEESL